MRRQIPFLELKTMHEHLGEELKAKFADVLAEGVFSAGKEVHSLEENVGKMLGLPHAIACSNGTDALELSLKASGIGYGDEVIVPALTWISTAEAVANVRAKPIFCDINEEGLMTLETVESVISPKTKAIIPVHLYGKMVHMPRLMGFARQHGLKVIEDAAQAFGAWQQGRSAGSFGDTGCYSFYPTKNIGALGEAGMITCKDKALEQQIRILLNHGQSERDVHPLQGRNSKIDSLQAAFLNVKLRHFGSWQTIRKKLAAIYLHKLKDIAALRLPEGILEEDHNAHLFAIQTARRDALKQYLEQQGIGTAIHYPKPIHMTEAFRSHNSLPMSEKISKSTLSLPLHPYLKEEEVEWICEKVRKFFTEGDFVKNY
ncbi:MAG TPA: DegT/DnrJ/EryC1/StrS family aminotransferase [Cyclobacteriaceae bacterium]|nr:DegT/DnrJ/EryC1/StrS family aminotransferase [Cyclobacteriaceae bacterium]